MRNVRNLACITAAIHSTFLVLIALVGPQAAGQCSTTSTCRANGHTASFTSTSPIQGVNWPYSEDITLPGFSPIADVTVTQALGWVKIDTGCVDTSEYNVASLGTFHGVFRLQATISNNPPPTASSGSRYEVQLRLGTSAADPNPRVLLDETRRLGGQYPQADHFGVIAPNLAAGNYVYTIWARLLASGNATFTNTWSATQGLPATFPAAAVTAPSDVSVGTGWTNVGPSLSLSNSVAADVILGSHWQIVSGTTAPGLQIRYAIDGIGPSLQFGQIGVPAAAGLPEGYDAFDAAQNIGPGNHTLQLQMRTTNFTAIIRGATLEYAAPPATLASPPSWSAQFAIASDTVHVSQVGSPTQPDAGLMIDGCGKWTLLLEFDVPAHSGGYNWIFEAYVQYLGNLTGTPRAQLAIENVHYNLDGNGNRIFDASADNGITAANAPAGRDGVYLFGESFLWGNGDGGNRIRLWARRISGCGSGATGGFDIGKRFLSVKLVPAEGCFPQ